MPVNLSIRDVPNDIAERLRARAKRNHRSLQGELMALIEAACEPGGLREEAREYKAPPRVVTKELLDEITRRARERGLGNLGESSTVTIRRMRDERYGPKKYDPKE